MDVIKRGNVYRIAFQRQLADQDIEDLMVDASQLTNTGVAAPSATVATLVPGTTENTISFVRADGESFSAGDVQARVSTDQTRIEFVGGSARVDGATALVDDVVGTPVPRDGVLPADANFRLLVDGLPVETTVLASSTSGNSTRLSRLTGDPLTSGVLTEDAFFTLTLRDANGLTVQEKDVLLPLEDGTAFGFDGQETPASILTASNPVPSAVLSQDATFALKVGSDEPALVLVPASATADNNPTPLGFSDTVSPAMTITGATALTVFELPQDVTFSLKVGGGSFTPIRVFAADTVGGHHRG